MFSRFVFLFALVVSSPILAQCTCPDTASVIDFESGLMSGDIVGAVSDGNGIAPPAVGDPVLGSVGVLGLNPAFPAANAAMIFDADCTPGSCTGGDDDLSFPGLGNVLIISEDLDSGDPDDGDLTGNLFSFDFSSWGTGTVTLHCMTVGDVEGVEGGAFAELFDAGGLSIGTVLLPITGNNVAVEVGLGGVSGVAAMEVTLNGSGMIDNICIEPDDVPPPNGGQLTPTGTECTDVIAGTATQLEVMPINTSGRTSPGAFMFWAPFDSPDAAFTVQVSQSNDSGAPAFGLIGAKLFADGCQNISNLSGVSISHSMGVTTFTVSAAVASQFDSFWVHTKHSKITNAVHGAEYTFTATSSTGDVVTDTVVTD